ncbi:MAG: OsmC family protein [Acidimicrobiia bacterium]
MTTTTRLNEIDLAAVGSLVRAIQVDSTIAATKWQAEVTWQKGFQVEARSRDLPVQEFDEPPTLGGSNAAANPVEQVLSALGACLAIGYASNASAAGIEIKDLRIELEGDLDLHTFLGLAA